MIVRQKQLAEVEFRIISLLLAQLDCNQARKTPDYGFSPNGAYTSEAFGMLRTLNILNLKIKKCRYIFHFGADNMDTEGNLKWWWNLLQKYAKNYASKHKDFHTAYLKWQDEDSTTRKTNWELPDSKLDQ